MKPLTWTLLACLATSLALAQPAAADPDLPRLGGECDGLVDVDCDDYNRGAFVRHCLVWHIYLDVVSPLEPFGVCQDNPYHP